MEWLYYLILLLFLASGVVLNLLTLPGNWVMLVATLIYAWLTQWNYFGWFWLIALLVIAIVGEIVEFTSSGKAVVKVGGSRWGSWGAIIGGVLGGVFLSGLIPIIFPISAILGILAGTFIGSSVAEMLAGRKVNTSLVIGTAAAKGQITGMIIKSVLGVVIALLVVVRGLPIW